MKRPAGRAAVVENDGPPNSLRETGRALTDRLTRPYEPRRAQVAEVVDALVSGTSGASREGSSPFLGTNSSSFPGVNSAARRGGTSE